MKLLALLIAGLAAGAASAQTLKPGLWELRQTPQLDPARKAQMAQAQKAMENMPPEQRAMMEQMMAQRGVSVNMAGGVITVKACITKEQAERDLAPVGSQGSCTQDVKRSGNVIRTHFVCSDPAAEGDSTVTLRGSDSFSNEVTIRHNRQGQTETSRVSGEGRWLGADCGAVQPMKSQARP